MVPSPMSKEIFLHKMMKAPRMRRGKAEEFLKIEGDDPGEIQRLLFGAREESLSTLPEPANDKVVPVGTIEAQDIHDCFALG